MKQKSIVASAKWKAFPHIEKNTNEKVKVKLPGGGSIKVEKIKFEKLSEDYIRKILLKNKVTDILDKDIEEKTLKYKLNKVNKYKNVYSSTAIENIKNRIRKEYDEKINEKINPSEIIGIINKIYFPSKAFLNILLSQNIQVIDSAKKKAIEDAQNKLQTCLEMESNKETKKRISVMITELKTMNYDKKSESSTAMVNRLCLNLFEYLRMKLKGYREVTIHRIIVALLRSILVTDKINEQVVKSFIKNAKTKK